MYKHKLALVLMVISVSLALSGVGNVHSVRSADLPPALISGHEVVPLRSETVHLLSHRPPLAQRVRSPLLPDRVSLPVVRF
jgi:hypothetical protein